MNAAGALAAARRAGVDRLDAHRLLTAATGRSRTWLLAHDDAPLGADAERAFAATLQRRAAGEPLAYILGHKEFHGIDLHVTPDVLVPRPDTELIVDWAIERLAAAAPPRPIRIVDLGTGSGAIAIAVALAAARSGVPVEVTAVDRSAAALAVARDNAGRLGAPMRFLCGDWWAPLAGERHDLALANPPYIADGDPHLAALGHEPREALVAGEDGLAALRRIIAGATAHLSDRAWLLLEHGRDQAEAVRTALHAAGFQDVCSRRDLAGHERCTGGRARIDHPAPDLSA